VVAADFAKEEFWLAMTSKEGEEIAMKSPVEGQTLDACIQAWWASKAMKFLIAAGAALLSTRASAVELTKADWDEKTAGKSVFVKFLAPW